MSTIVRQPVLKPEEEKLLKEVLEPLWKAGYTAREITEKLNFSIAGTKWEKLKKYHVYFYRSKFGFEPRRRRERGKSRYKVKHEEVMSPDEFIQTLNEKLPPNSFHNRRKRAYLILHYWTPLRKSEIYEREIEDFKIDRENRVLTINLFRKKKKTAKKEPIEVPLEFPLMEEVVTWLENREWKEKPFNISHQTAWLWVKSVFETYYPHFFRFNYITDGFDDPNTTLEEMRTKTGLSIATLNKYLMASRRAGKRFDQRKLERLKKREFSSTQPITLE